ncbi:universal stress protein [Streptomyces sp. NPDC052109]|uniref:universal stress protein n=1 Tax=Streptomyces sp. NPDC052109 TaxID=3155527 RepID=UPI00343065F3
MCLPLVVGVDGSDSSLLAVEWAADEAGMHGLPLRLVYAPLWERYEGRPPSTGPLRRLRPSTADDLVAAAAERARRRAPAVPVECAVLPEEPVDALLREGHNATALVTGRRGRGELRGVLLGSVALTVAGRAAGPVIVVRGDTAGIAGTHGRIVLGVGEPGTSDRARDFALREAAARKCVLDVVRAWRRPARQPVEHPRHAEDLDLDEEERAAALIEGLLEDPGTPVTDQPELDARVLRRVVEGPARTVLLQRSAAADLLVVGVPRRRSRGGLELGRVAHTVLHHASCPVAVVPDFP